MVRITMAKEELLRALSGSKDEVEKYTDA